MRTALVSLATLLCFGCQTVRPAATLPAGPPPRVALAEPLLDLWVEGAGAVTPEERDQGLSQARTALGAALEGRAFVAPAEADHLLVIQEQAVARTEGRRSQQVAAVLGIAVVVVAVVVLVAILARGSDSGSSRGRPAGAVPAAGGGAARAAPPRGAPAPGLLAAPRGPYGPPAPFFGWSFDVGIHAEVPLAGPPLLPPGEPPALEGRLPARGFFAGDETELVLELRDARSGATVWSQRVSEDVDPRDPAAVRALLDRAAAGQAWARPEAPLSRPGNSSKAVEKPGIPG